MKGSEQRTDGKTTTYRRSTGLAVLVTAAVTGLAACGGSTTPQVASVANTSRSASAITTAALSAGSSGNDGGSTTTTPAKRNPIQLLDEWATCMHSHGDPNQADPIIDAHGVINITLPPPGQGGLPVGNAHGVTGTCSQYLAAAQRALRAADPVPDPLGMTNQADLLRYVNCMRANGVPNYPYPTGNTTNFNGTGVDPNSPFVLKVSIKCGNKLHLPLWWSAGWGPPGDVTAGPAIPPGAHAPSYPVPGSGASNQGAAPAVAGSTGGSGTDG